MSKTMNTAPSVEVETQGSYSFTIRLTVEDQAILKHMCASYGLNRPDTLRRVLREAWSRRLSISSELPSGAFIPLGRAAAFPIRWKRRGVVGDAT